jgi:hypothetical protein
VRRIKWLLQTICVMLAAFALTACMSASYKILAPLEPGPIRIEYQGKVYFETGTFSEKPQGERVFRIGYNEVCSTVSYDVYIVDNKMYLCARQPFWADMAAVSYVLSAEQH